MASTINADNGVVSGSSGLKSTADTSGVLALQTNGTTALTINTDLSATFAGAVTASSFSGTTTTATNLAGGSNGTIPYQSASGTTQMLAAGTSGQVLTSNGAAAPTWATPAPGAGTVTAVASGTLPNGATVIVNSDGTVSVPAATGASSITTIGSSVANTSSIIVNNARTVSACYGSKDNIVVLFYIGPSNYVYAIAGKISGTTVTFGSPATVNSSYPCSAGTNYGLFAAYDYVNNQYFCLYYQSNNGYGAYVQCKFNANLGFVSSNNQPNSWATGNLGTNINPLGYTLIISPTLNGSNVQGLITYMSNNNGYIYTLPVVCTSSNTMTMGAENSLVYAPSASYQTLPTFGDVPSKAMYCYLDSSYYPRAVIVTLNGTAQPSLGTSVQLEANYSAGFPTVAGYSATLNKYFAVWGRGGAVWGCVVSLSGTTSTAGTVAQVNGLSGGSGNNLYGCAEYKLTGDLWVQSDNSVVKITISGTTFTNSGASSFSNAETARYPGTFFYDDGNYTWVLASIGNNNFYQQLTFATAYSTTMTATNFIGFSSASYTNGQTATINTVGSTNSGVSGLTTGSGYYVLPNGALTTTATSNYAGVALSATKILVKG